MSNPMLTLLGAVIAALAIGMAVLAGSNHVRRWWVAAAIFGAIAVVLLGLAVIRSGVLMPEFKPLFDLEQ
ncbi:MAG TPA: hypothetical protein VJM32_02790 [Candidatus Saccharimonadales bacterium]|nr:hypothetical protein [Candidatus Saccharimonadales bacterium]